MNKYLKDWLFFFFFSTKIPFGGLILVITFLLFALIALIQS